MPRSPRPFTATAAEPTVGHGRCGALPGSTTLRTTCALKVGAGTGLVHWIPATTPAAISNSTTRAATYLIARMSPLGRVARRDPIRERGAFRRRIGLRFDGMPARVLAHVGGEPYDAQTVSRHQGERYFPLLLCGGSWVRVVSGGSRGRKSSTPGERGGGPEAKWQRSTATSRGHSTPRAV